MVKPLPHATYRVYSKRGPADCSIAAMATIFRRDPEEVLIAASRISPTVWRSGLHLTEMLKVARRLKVKVRVKYAAQIDPDDDIGVLWISYNDRVDEHCVSLVEGWVLDPEEHPVSLWRYADYMTVQNAVPNGLLEVVE